MKLCSDVGVSMLTICHKRRTPGGPVAETPRRYWFRFHRGIRVTFHALSDWDVLWTRIYGLQFRGWFIGIVKSTDVPSDWKDEREIANG